MFAEGSDSSNGGDAAGWLTPYEAELEHDPTYVAETIALAVTEEALQIMQERGISRSQLADAMGVSRAYITRIFNAPPNLTLRSIAQLSLALGARPELTLSCPDSGFPHRPGL